MNQPAETDSANRFPWATVIFLLAAAAFAYGWFTPGMGANSDDLTYGHISLSQVYSYFTTLRPRLIQTVAVYGMFWLLWPHWTLIHWALIGTLLIGIFLLSALVWKWTGDRAATLLAGAVYAIHPASNDSVLWSENLAHLAVSVFLVASLYAATRFAETGRKRHAAGAALWCFCALGCIEQAYAAVPALAAALLICGGSWKRCGCLAALFLAVAASQLALQYAMFNPAVQQQYPYALDASLAPRLWSVWRWTAKMLTVGGEEFTWPPYLSAGVAALRNSPALLAAFGAVAIAGWIVAWREFSRRAVEPPPDAVRRAGIIGLLGVYFVLATAGVMALRSDAHIHSRHLRTPLVGLAFIAAALAYGARALAARRRQPQYRLAFAGSALLTACLGAAMLADLAEGKNYVDSWTYQKLVADEIAACTPSKPAPDMTLRVEELISHFGRTPTFADDWTLNGLMQTLHPEKFSDWRGEGIVTLFVENTPREQFPKILSMRRGPAGMIVRDKIEYREDGQVVETVPLPAADGSPCPRETLVVERRSGPIGVLFGDELALLGWEATMRPGQTLASLTLFFRQAPSAAPPQISLALSWRRDGAAFRQETQRWTNVKPGVVAGVKTEFLFAQIPAAAELSIAATDAARGPLPPRANGPIRQLGNGVILRFE